MCAAPISEADISHQKMLKALRINSRKLAVSECDQELKVRYLGNVQTTFTLGDQCADRPVAALWANYVRNMTPTPMTLTACAWGMKVETKQHGVTEYRAHRISYFAAHPAYPGLFVWIYRHEGGNKRMKVSHLIGWFVVTWHCFYTPLVGKIRLQLVLSAVTMSLITWIFNGS